MGRHRKRQGKRLLFSGLGLCLVAAPTLVIAGHSGGTRPKVVTGGRPTAPTSPGVPSASPLGKTGVPSLPLDATSVSFLSPVQGWVSGFAPVTAGGQVPSNIEVAHTSDGGLSWSGVVIVATVQERAPQPRIDFEDALHGWISGPGIFETQDGGQTWKSANVAGLGTGSAGLSRTTSSQAFIYQAKDGSPPSLDETTDGGSAWRAVTNPCSNPSNVLLSASNASNLWAVCASQGGAGIAGKSVYTSVDGGSSWSLQARAPTSEPPVGTITPGGYPSQLVVTSAMTGFLGLGRYGLIQSMDGGKTWNDGGAGDGPSGFVNDISFADAAHGWVIFCGGLERTTDGGGTWSTIGTAPGIPTC